VKWKTGRGNRDIGSWEVDSTQELQDSIEESRNHQWGGGLGVALMVELERGVVKSEGIGEGISSVWVYEAV
jgi:hypothetical protein